MEVNRRSQADRSAATREALVAAGRDLFSVHGFAGVGTETIVRQAGVTRGALYHQFADKTELFAAVFEDVEQSISTEIERVAVGAGVTDPIAAMKLGAEAWLDASTDPQVRQVVLLDAPAVLGWERWREIGMRYGMGLVEGLLQHAITVGRLDPQPVAPLAHVLVGALDEAALYVAGAEDQAAARVEVQVVVDRLIAALADDR